MNDTTVYGQGGIQCRVVAASLHPSKDGRVLWTLQWRYPRFIHAEVMTHRVFSRNASSSRAIPVVKVLEQVRNDPAMPIHWGVNQPGMQAHQELSPQDCRIAEVYWRESARRAADMAEEMMKMGLHKQVVNRILEPYQFMHTITTATEWQNFFDLRYHEDAEPTIQELARVSLEAMADYEPEQLAYSDWHLPYVTAAEIKKYTHQVCRMISAARCARVSYLTHDGKAPDVAKDIELFTRLVGSVPLHASPIEHQATPADFHPMGADSRHLWGNLVHWVQFRKLHELNFVNQENQQ